MNRSRAGGRSRGGRRARAGFSLSELLMVMFLMGIILAYMAPKMGRMRAQGHIKSARDQVRTAIVSARAAAVQNGRAATVYRTGNRVAVRVETGTAGVQKSVIGALQLDSLYQVSLEAGPDSIRYDPRGFARLNGVQKFVFIRLMPGGKHLRDSICVTAFGAILKSGCISQ